MNRFNLGRARERAAAGAQRARVTRPGDPPHPPFLPRHPAARAGDPDRRPRLWRRLRSPLPGAAAPAAARTRDHGHLPSRGRYTIHGGVCGRLRKCGRGRGGRGEAAGRGPRPRDPPAGTRRGWGSLPRPPAATRALAPSSSSSWSARAFRGGSPGSCLVLFSQGEGLPEEGGDFFFSPQLREKTRQRQCG